MLLRRSDERRHPLFRKRRQLCGFGLGLTICKYIVEAHGGTIAAANHRDGGAEFSFILPMSAAAGEQGP